MEFIFLVFTGMSGGVYVPWIYLHARWELWYHRQLWSLLWHMCDVFLSTNSLVRWFCMSALGPVVFLCVYLLCDGSPVPWWEVVQNTWAVTVCVTVSQKSLCLQYFCSLESTCFSRLFRLICSSSLTLICSEEHCSRAQNGGKFNTLVLCTVLCSDVWTCQTAATFVMFVL